MGVHYDIVPLSDHEVSLIVDEAQLDRRWDEQPKKRQWGYTRHHWRTRIEQLLATIKRLRGNQNIKVNISNVVVKYLERERSDLVATNQHLRAEIERKNRVLKELEKVVPEELKPEVKEALVDRPYVQGRRG